ncbi:hypothetical protein AVEN_179062-1 [Araneus ventricosus]|uniref:Uncharacterized protein n=2 Tax=Araneus ventricosus TaxID=182803 RepID=A0A4Y2Q750_ARAVE|nr:hypothetical protein AVEN_179062-1 [Araneus ventricosus]
MNLNLCLKINLIKDNLLKRVVTIPNENFHDYLCTVMDTSRQIEWPNHVFDETDGDLSFGLPLAACI